MPIETTEKIPYRARTNIVTNGIAFSLNVNTIKAKSILVNYAINSIITATAKSATRIGSGTAETHAQKQIDDKALKKIRWSTANSIKQFLSERSVYLTMRRPHCFVGRLRLGL